MLFVLEPLCVEGQLTVMRHNLTKLKNESKRRNFLHSGIQH